MPKSALETRVTRATTTRAASSTHRPATPAASRKKGRFVDPDDDSDADMGPIEISSEEDEPPAKRLKTRAKPTRTASFIDDGSAGSSGESYIEAVEVEKTTLKKKLKRSNDALKRKEKAVKENEKAEKKAEKLVRKMEYKEGQRISLLELPNEVIERCFSLDFGILQLGDFLALNWTCRTFRNAMDDVSWETVYMKAGPGKKGIVNDRWSLSIVASEDMDMMVGMERIRVPRAAYCKGINERRSPGHRYRAVQLGLKANAPTEPGSTPLERLAALVDEQNDLISQHVAPPGPLHILPPPIEALNHALVLQHTARTSAAVEAHNAKAEIHKKYHEACSKVLLQKLPLTRGELSSIKGGEGNMLTKARQRDIGPWEVICLRAYNFPLIGLSELMLKTFLSATDIKAAIQPVPKDLFVRNHRSTLAQLGEHFYAKDADRMIIARLNLIKAKEAKVRAERKAATAKAQLGKALEEGKARKKQIKYSQENYLCEWCGTWHLNGFVCQVVEDMVEWGGLSD